MKYIILNNNFEKTQEDSFTIIDVGDYSIFKNDIVKVILINPEDENPILGSIYVKSYGVDKYTLKDIPAEILAKDVGISPESYKLLTPEEVLKITKNKLETSIPDLQPTTEVFLYGFRNLRIQGDKKF